MKARPRWRLIIGLLVIVVVGVGIAASWSKFRGTEASLPTAKVESGDVDLKVFTRGEMRTPNIALLMAPSVGGTLQIVHFAKTGEMVKAGDVVLEFDPSEQEYNLEQAQSQLRMAEEQITKSKDDGAVSAANDQVGLLHARYDVRRAELDVSQNELKSAIDAKKNDLALEDAKRRLAQLEQDVQSRVASNKAQIAVLEAQRTKAQLDIKQAETRIQSMTVKAPISGLMNREGNQDTVSNFFFTGMTLPEYQEGDQTFPGRIVGKILDVSQMEILAQVPETARADINPNQTASITMDAMPEKNYTGKVKTIAGMATQGNGRDPTRRFDVTFQIDQPDPRLRPGQTADVVVQSEMLRNVLHIPRQALFIRDAKPVVYVKAGRGFEQRAVTVKHTTESQVVIEGLLAGTEVALVNPESAGPGSGSASSPTSAIGGKR
jgi:HlyD family secretion protein